VTNRAFKILSGPQWEDFQTDGHFRGALIDVSDGYIHLSTADQVAETLAKHFAGQSGLFVLEIDLDLYGSDIRWEVSRGGALFPHLYGILRMDSVIEAKRVQD
jgi:uncharacterized protein (DUF952 family)